MKSTGVWLIAAALPLCAAAQTDLKALQQSLQKELVSNQVTGRFPYSGRNVVVAADGKCESDCERGSWAGDATFIIRKVRVTKDELAMTCDRLAVYYDQAGQPRASVSPISIQFHIKVSGAATEESIRAALRNVFLAPTDPPPNGPPPDLEHSTGPYEIKRVGHNTLVREKTGTEWKKVMEIDSPIQVGELVNGEKIYIVSHTVTPPHAISTPDPMYSAEDRQKRHQGTVVLRIVVDSTGRVQAIKVERADFPGFIPPSVMAISQWKFEPATRNAQPVACEISVEMTFHLY